MTGIDRIISKINDDAEAEAARIISEAEAEADKILDEAKAKAITRAEAIVAEAEAERYESEVRATSNANLESRKLRLAVKQELINSAFEKALRELRNMPEGRYCEFLVNLARSAATKGSEIILSKRDHDKFGAFLNEELKKAGIDAVVAKDCRETGGGLIVRSGRVEINCTIGALVSQQRDKLAAEVVGILF